MFIPIRINLSTLIIKGAILARCNWGETIAVTTQADNVQYNYRTGCYIPLLSNDAGNVLKPYDPVMAAEDLYRRRNGIIVAPPIVGDREMTWQEWADDIKSRGSTPSFDPREMMKKK